MSFARKEELHGTIRIAQDARQALRIEEDQRRALISSKATSEADGQRGFIENLLRFNHFFERTILPKDLLAKSPANEFDRPATQEIACPPQFLRRNAINAIPQFQM